MLGVGDVLFQDAQAVDLGRELGRQHGARDVSRFGDFTRRARRVGGDHGFEPQRPDDVAALPKRMDMALDRLDGLERRALGRHQLVLHRQEPLRHDMQPRRRHQMMDIRHPAGHRIVDRNHGERGAPGADRGEGILESRTRQRLHVPIGLAAGDVRIRSGLALIGDLAAIAAAFGHDLIMAIAIPVVPLAWRAPFPNPRAYRRRAARCRRSRRRCACRLPAPAIVRAFRDAPSGDGGSLTKRSSAARRNA